MPGQITVLRNMPQQNLYGELKLFISQNKQNPIELTKTSLLLLKKLPACRGSIFDYFSGVFVEAVFHYIQRLETEINTGKLPAQSESDEVIIIEIHTTLNSLIIENSINWATTISTWSLELLGEISTDYSGRAHISTNLNETLQLWMGCRATRMLVDLNTKCLSSLIHSDTEACISALLDTSVKHSPNFDWVVAHVGSCFPNTVITRVLSVGLKDFAQNRSYDQVQSSPKLKSVVGILGHLAGSHAADIREAIIEMFMWGLKKSNISETDSTRLQKKATVPYILQLIYLSDTLLSSICNETENILSVNVIGKLYHQTSDWIKYFGTPEAIEEHVISLILKCQTGGLQILNLLIQCTQVTKLKGQNASIKSDIREKSLDLLESILQEMEDSVRYENPVDILSSLVKDIQKINEMLFSPNKVVSTVAYRLVLYLGHINPSILIKSCTHLLEYATTSEQLALVIKILTSELVDKTSVFYVKSGGHFSVVIEQILSRNIQKYSIQNEETLDLSQMWMNLLTLLEWEKNGTVPIMHSSRLVTRALEENFNHLTSVFASEKHHMHIIADILDKTEIPPGSSSYNPPIRVILNLTQSAVNYFFACCREQGTSKSKLLGFKKAARILTRLCIFSKVAKVLALRELLERALFRDDNVLFGAKNSVVHDSSEKSLLKQNKKINKTIPLTKHSSVFNGGVIGLGKRKAIIPDDISPEVVAASTAELVTILKACCALPEENKYSEISLDSMTLLSLLVVQFVSPDVMYNGLPWPEEEFSKVTIERDLFIRRIFTNTPLLWDLLSFIAVYRPALCYCSVLIRALTATLIHQWKSMGDQSKDTGNENYTSLLDTTIRLIDIMTLGQLLPPPLCHIRDVLPSLRCFEIVDILRDCIWCYMRDHIPSPALFSCDPSGIHWRDPVVSRPHERYTNTLRIILQRNIDKLGHLYSQMFINLPRHE
ncbi:integrator complex subunit 5 [Anthonomus grandis grandis]|uniref:integrator complex subunit 5 n=1 Tax=Anthonomus grandis grandis TaxID=2921223 RepID=UPI0021653F6D|nr:integrator complex subunit 5 [Anthonomus grandis grandis]